MTHRALPFAVLLTAAVAVAAPTTTAPATRPAADPQTVVERFIEAAHTGDAKAAAAFVAGGDAAGGQRLKHLIDGVTQGMVDFSVVGVRVDGDVAVVTISVFEPGKADHTEPAPLVRTPDGWKIAFESKDGLPPAQKDRIERLVQTERNAARGAATRPDTGAAAVHPAAVNAAAVPIRVRTTPSSRMMRTGRRRTARTPTEDSPCGSRALSNRWKHAPCSRSARRPASARRPPAAATGRLSSSAPRPISKSTSRASRR